METTLNYKSPEDHYVSDACVVWCFDARFSALLGEHIKKEELQNIDLVKVAGGVKELVSPENNAHRDYLLDQIKKSIALHETKKIVLMAHSECGAYGGTRDEAFYASELKKAKDVVATFCKSLGSELPVEAYFAHFEGLSRIA
jgi:carbonic anhydrase